MWTNPQENAALVTFTEEILNPFFVRCWFNFSSVIQITILNFFFIKEKDRSRYIFSN